LILVSSLSPLKKRGDYDEGIKYIISYLDTHALTGGGLTISSSAGDGALIFIFTVGELLLALKKNFL